MIPIYDGYSEIVMFCQLLLQTPGFTHNLNPLKALDKCALGMDIWTSNSLPETNERNDS